MKRLSTTRTMLKPPMWTLEIPDLPATDDYLNNYAWMEIREVIECAGFRLGHEGKVRPNGYGLALFDRYGLLNGESGGEPLVTWVASLSEETEVMIQGVPPSEELFHRERCYIFIPATWALNILDLASQGVVNVKAVSDTDNKGFFSLFAELVDGSVRQILMSGRLPGCKYYLKSE